MAALNANAEIILAAVNRTPALEGETTEEYRARVMVAIMEIASMVREGSTASTLVDWLLDDEAIRLTGTLTNIEFEDRSQRYIVTFKTKPTAKNPEGIDQLRTARVDGPFGGVVRSMLEGKKGHYCLFLKRFELTKDGHKIRIVPFIEAID